MKKFVALLLAALMALSCVAALAETTPSVTIEGIPEIETEPAEVMSPLTKVPETAADDFEAVNNETDYLTLIPAEAVQLVYAIAGEGATVNELVPVEINKDYEGDANVKLVFATPYQEGTPVAVIFAAYAEDGSKEVFVLTGNVNANGEISVYVPSDVLAKLAAAEAVTVAIAALEQPADEQ